ncbi:hypothetical protein LXL04_009240 [Taraxacum kok-saghyz]
MSSRTPQSTGRTQSLFFNDLATPVTNRRSGSTKFTTPGQAAAVSALWRENFATSDLPPPPVFTLEDRSDFSPEPDYPLPNSSPDHTNSPNPKSTPLHTPSKSLFPKTPNKSPSPFSSSPPTNSNPATSSVGGPHGGSSWWSPAGKGAGSGSGSPVDGVVHRQPGALVILPPPREVARPELERNSSLPLGVGTVDEEEWVTIYGFSPGDTNLVLREFEKCGVILKHVPGPRDSNWMHILYQSRFDAQKALGKNGMQLNGALIIGVKLVDPMQRQALTNRLMNNHGGFMPLPPPTTATASVLKGSTPYFLNGNSNNNSQSGGTMASPSKSVISRIADLMFGV